VRLKIAQTTTHDIYLGSNNNQLDAYIGEWVRIEGKIVTVLQRPELWPARITVLGDQQRP
jgi:hypothetical protein